MWTAWTAAGEPSGTSRAGRHATAIWAAAIGGMAILLYWVCTAHLAFGYADESWLWYGAQRVLAGEVPLRDFHSYDPGRYYLAAAVMALGHSHGIVALRVAEALIAAIGVGLANWLVFKGCRRHAFWLCAAVTLSFIAWASHNHHKIFDTTSSIVLVAALAWLMEKPAPLRLFMNGAVIGLVAIIGRNHGLYGAVAGFAAIVVVCWVERRAVLWRSLALWGAGIAAGYSPMLLAALFVPGFWHWLWLSVHVYFTMGETSNAVPIMWPWRVNFHAHGNVLRHLATGCLFILQPATGLLVSGYLIWRSMARKVAIPPLLFAAAVLSIFYIHHALARAGTGHLAQAIFPFLICVFVLVQSLPGRSQAVVAAAVCAFSIYMMIFSQALVQRWQAGNWVDAKVGSDVLSMPSLDARRVSVLQKIIDRYAPGGREFIAAPNLPAAYAMADRRAAVWDNHVFFNFGPEVQAAELPRIQAEQPAFVLIEDMALDGDPDLAYPNTNPQVYDYIQRNFEARYDPLIPRYFGWTLYLPKPAPKD